jgi:single-strand DNA-binding protein
MAIPVTIIGPVVGEETVKLKFSANGRAIASFTVMEIGRKFDKDANEWVDSDKSFYDVSLFGKDAENAAESIERNDRVIVTGKMSQREYQTSEGENRRVWQVNADEVALSCKFRKVTAERQEGSSNRPQQQNRRPVQQIQDSDVPF